MSQSRAPRRVNTVTALLLSLYIAAAGPILFGGLVWAATRFAVEPRSEQWYVGGLLGVLLLASLNGIANYRLRIAKWKFWSWKELLARARSDRRVAIRLLAGSLSSFVIGFWVVHGAGIPGWGFKKVSCLVIAGGAWPLSFMVRPLFGRDDLGHS